MKWLFNRINGDSDEVKRLLRIVHDNEIHIQNIERDNRTQITTIYQLRKELRGKP
jgi:hypothetical protein